jgi:hypothetical protein
MPDDFRAALLSILIHLDRISANAEVLLAQHTDLDILELGDELKEIAATTRAKVESRLDETLP